MGQKTKVFSFIPGKRYKISYNRRESTPIPNDFTYIYEKRINKIHVFREVNFGWTRGLSDIQIKDKIIQEVK